MKCPKCKKEISKVGITTGHWQQGKLEGNRVVKYGEGNYIDDSMVIECPECLEDITESIKV